MQNRSRLESRGRRGRTWWCFHRRGGTAAAAMRAARAEAAARVEVTAACGTTARSQTPPLHACRRKRSRPCSSSRRPSSPT
eukprot:5690111-Prymnesium_polylepis.2